MTNTVIYISIVNGIETLTLDGNLYLFGELLTTLNDAARGLSRTVPIDARPAEDLKQEQGGTHVKR